MIINKTNNRTISEKELICSNFFSFGRGLMFRRKQNLLMVFKKPRKIRLHMWFVFFSIDVLVLDEEKRIVEIKRNFRPFTFWNSEKEGKYLVELGSPGEYEIGDKIKIISAQ